MGAALGKGFNVRMLTYHLGVHKWWEDPSLVEAEVYKLQEAVDSLADKAARPSTLRLTLQPAPSPRLAGESSSELGELSESTGVLVNVGFYPSSSEWAPIRSAVLDGLYLSILLEDPGWARARELAKLLNVIAEEDVNAATRLAVNVSGRPLATPYYPLSSSKPGERALSVGLTYPTYLLHAYQSRGLEGLEEAVLNAGTMALRALEEAASKLGVGVLGVDLSVAPWMEDSSLALVEAVAGTRLPEPGVAFGIATINKILRRAASRLGRATGFNEVQLPVGEDSKLKARVSEGDTTARDLARLAGVCVAGLDMAVVPYSEVGVAGLILEVASHSLVSGKALGVRLIPLEGVEPGDKVMFDRFGEIPVIPI